MVLIGLTWKLEYSSFKSKGCVQGLRDGATCVPYLPTSFVDAGWSPGVGETVQDPSRVEQMYGYSTEESS